MNKWQKESIGNIEKAMSANMGVVEAVEKTKTS
jgi:hypothetical protein